MSEIIAIDTICISIMQYKTRIVLVDISLPVFNLT